MIATYYLASIVCIVGFWAGIMAVVGSVRAQRWSSPLFLPVGWEARLVQYLARAGNPRGMGPSLFVAVSVAYSIAGATVGVVVGLVSKGGVPLALTGGILGLFLPLLRLQDLIHERRKRIARELPLAVELIALSMGAGFGFSGALRHVVHHLDARSPVQNELGWVVHQMHLGASKFDALHMMADKLQMVELRRFVASVVQSEQKGTPLSEVLKLQAQSMRERRSQLAEQTIAAAQLKILGPLMLIFISVFVLLLGPFLVRWVTGTMFS